MFILASSKKKNKKRILVVCQHFWPEAFRINDICDYLVENDCEVEVICGQPNYPSGKFSEGYGYFKKRHEIHNKITIHRTFEIPRGSNSNLRIFLNYLSFPIASMFHIPRLMFHKYDRIFIYQLSPVMMGISGLMLGKLKRIPTITYVLDLWPENLYSVVRIKGKFWRWFAAKNSHWYYKKSDKLIALSDRMRGKLVKVTSKSANEILVLPQTCEKIYEVPIKDQALLNKFKDGFNIVYAGNISPAQSFETIIEAAKILRKENINWIIVGDGMSKNAVEASVHKNNLSNKFFFEGQKPVDDIPRYNYIADSLIGCLVKSDLLEATIPAKVMSYIASGKPMILAMDGEVQTLINKTIKCGYAGPTGDAKALAKNIQQLINMSVSERKAMGLRARKYHFANFERNLILKQLQNFIFN